MSKQHESQTVYNFPENGIYRVHRPGEKPKKISICDLSTIDLILQENSKNLELLKTLETIFQTGLKAIRKKLKY